MEDNKLSLNVYKMKCMYFGAQQRLNACQFDEVYCEGEVVEQVPTFKYLGYCYIGT